jgi:hypothetical protein
LIVSNSCDGAILRRPLCLMSRDWWRSERDHTDFFTHHPMTDFVLAAREQADLLWYTMPFIEGESLRAGLERKRVSAVREVVRILHGGVDALAFAHERGVVAGHQAREHPDAGGPCARYRFWRRQSPQRRVAHIRADLGRHRHRNASSRPVAKTEVLASLDALLLSTLTYVDDMIHAPRRPGPPSPPSSR